MARPTTRVSGFRELARANARAPKTFRREYRHGLREVAEPVRSAAEARSAVEIRNIPRSPAWGRMRTGVTQRLVYVAPRQRGTRTASRKRRNLAGLLMERAMEPALEEHQSQIVRGFEGFLATMGRDWER